MSRQNTVFFGLFLLLDKMLCYGTIFHPKPVRMTSVSACANEFGLKGKKHPGTLVLLSENKRQCICCEVPRAFLPLQAREDASAGFLEDLARGERIERAHAGQQGEPRRVCGIVFAEFERDPVCGDAGNRDALVPVGIGQCPGVPV